MADKFPEIAADTTDSQLSDDLLTREKELLGEDAAEFQSNVIEEDEVEQFKQQFPDVEDDLTHEVNELKIEEPDQSSPAFPKETPTPVKEWQERFNLEISKRDEADLQTTENTRKEAEKQLDDFYESYNVKKDENIEKAKKQQEEFIEKRDSFFTEGNVWRRAAQLIKGLPENKRFKQVLDAKVRSIQD